MGYIVSDNGGRDHVATEHGHNGGGRRPGCGLWTVESALQIKELKLKSQSDRPQLSSGDEDGDDPSRRARERRKKPPPKKLADAGAGVA